MPRTRDAQSSRCVPDVKRHICQNTEFVTAEDHLDPFPNQKPDLYKVRSAKRLCSMSIAVSHAIQTMRDLRPDHRPLERLQHIGLQILRILDSAADPD